MKKGMISKVLVASVLAFTAVSSQAAVVENWDFALTMEWDIRNTVFESTGTGTQVRTPTELSWGYAYDKNANDKNKRSSDFFLKNDANKARSGLVITQPNVAGNINTSYEGGSLFTVDANMFRHYNSAIAADYKALLSTKMDVTVQLYLPGTGDLVRELTQRFEIHFYETPNISGNNCAWGVCENDIFAIISLMDFSQTFDYDGVSYTFNYFETNDKQIKQLSETTCKVMGFSAGSCFGFTTNENMATDVKFNFSITTAVPEPETYAMMLAGLGLVGIVARRRRNVIR